MLRLFDKIMQYTNPKYFGWQFVAVLIIVSILAIATGKAGAQRSVIEVPAGETAMYHIVMQYGEEFTIEFSEQDIDQVLEIYVDSFELVEEPIGTVRPVYVFYGEAETYPASDDGFAYIICTVQCAIDTRSYEFNSSERTYAVTFLLSGTEERPQVEKVYSTGYFYVLPELCNAIGHAGLAMENLESAYLDFSAVYLIDHEYGRTRIAWSANIYETRNLAARVRNISPRLNFALWGCDF